MFERFTDTARRVVVLAQEEAQILNHNYIGTEHLLLGLIHEGDGVAARALESLSVSLEAVRREVRQMIGQGEASPAGHIPFTPRAKKVLELSLREARQLGHDFIGTEHMLLGLIREGEGVAAQVLEKLGVDLHRARQTVIELLAEPGEASGEQRPAVEVESLGKPLGPRCPWCRRRLEETATLRTFQAPADAEGEEPVTVHALYCRECGRTLRTTMT